MSFEPGAARTGTGSASGLVARPVFKTASEAPRASLVGSIPTRSRHLATLLLLVLLACFGSSAQAQDPVRVPADSAAPDSIRPAPAVVEPDAVADTAVRRGPSPTGSLLKSLVLPGLGQITMGREMTAGVFIAIEAGTLAMVLKSQRDLDAANELGDQVAIDDAKRKREDWLVLMGLNHALSALEAYISAHLWDFPADLELRAAPGGGFSAGATLPFRLR